MSRSRTHVRKYKLKRLKADYFERDDPFWYWWGMPPRDYLQGVEHILRGNYERRGWANTGKRVKRAINRRVRHKAKDALRHRNPERMFRKWNGGRKVKTGYGYG